MSDKEMMFGAGRHPQVGLGGPGFEDLADQYHIYKVETVGDAYIVPGLQAPDYGLYDFPKMGIKHNSHGEVVGHPDIKRSRNILYPKLVFSKLYPKHSKNIPKTMFLWHRSQAGQADNPLTSCNQPLRLGGDFWEFSSGKQWEN